MGRQPRSGDIPWLSAHSILNWIGGDNSMLVLFTRKSRVSCKFLHGWPNRASVAEFAHCETLLSGPKIG